jgi:uncharacterized protein (UPF0332 family)
MILDPKDKKVLSDTRMEKAKEFLADAQATYNEKRYRTSVNRAYYAALNAVRAILILEGANPETHEGAVTLLSLRFIKTGILPVDVIKKFKILLSRRTDVDYGDFDTIDEKEAADSLKSAEELVVSMDATRKKMIAELDMTSKEETA